MLTIIPNPKAMNYDKLIDFLNKRKNIELNRFKQRGNKNVKDIEYRINKKNQPTRTARIALAWRALYSSTRSTRIQRRKIFGK